MDLSFSFLFTPSQCFKYARAWGVIVFHVWNVSLIIDVNHTYLQRGACMLSCTVLLSSFPPKSHICLSHKEVSLVSIMPIWFPVPQGKEFSPHRYLKICHLKFILLPWSLELNGLSCLLKQLTKKTKVESITCITSGKKKLS